MKIETQIQEDHQAKLTVEVEADILEGAKRRAARKLANRMKFPGFRPGKVPYPVILKQVGDGAILEEALDFVVNEIYPKVLVDANIQAYGPGKLENMSSKEPLTLEFLVPLKPEVVLGDYRSISKEYEKPQVNENDVDNMLEELRDRQAIIEPVDRPAQTGDIANIRFSSERKNVEEGQQLILIRDQPIQIFIREDTGSKEWPYPGFSKELIGLEAGQEKVLEYVYPEDAPTENLRGVEAIVRFAVENVKLRTLPELNDEFATSFGEFENMEALCTEIRSSLQQQTEHQYDEAYDEEILEAATSQATVKYPPQMLEREIDDAIDNLKSRLEKQKMDMDLYLKARNIDMEGLRKEAEPAAELRLKKSLVLMEIAKAENIELDPSEVQSETLNTMNTLSGMLPKKEAKKLSDRNVMQNLMNNVMAEMITRKAAERLRLIASGRMNEPEVEIAAKAEEDTSPKAEIVEAFPSEIAASDQAEPN